MAKNQTIRYLPLVLMGFGLVIIVGIVLLSILRPTSTNEQTSDSSIKYPMPDSEVPRINLGDAKAAYDLGSAVFLDVRGDMSYKEGHIPSALSIPEDQLSEQLSRLNTSDWIITYCT